MKTNKNASMDKFLIFMKNDHLKKGLKPKQQIPIREHKTKMPITKKKTKKQKKRKKINKNSSMGKSLAPIITA